MQYIYILNPLFFRMAGHKENNILLYLNTYIGENGQIRSYIFKELIFIFLFDIYDKACTVKAGKFI